MPKEEQRYEQKEYVKTRKKLTGIFFETALPNEYLVQIGRKVIRPILGGRSFRLFRKFIRIPASVQTIYFTTDNANVDYQGIGLTGYASWRIDPKRPLVSISTLDFFDEENPMARTNAELRSICIEAVRHVISNMTIDQALKQKEEIAENLKEQLKEVEEKWGLIFDQVGIESVKIMSNTLFEELQATFRDNLRLDVAKTKINTDRQIAAEQNSMREKTELEKIETDQKISLSNVDNESKLKEVTIQQEQVIELKEREYREDNYRKDVQFKMEQEKKNHDLSVLNKNLLIELQKIEKNHLTTQREIEDLNNEISKKQLEIEKLKKEIEQIYTPDALSNKFIEILPEVYSSINIQNYSVLDSSSNGNISPVSKLLNELIFSLKNSELSWLIKDRKEKVADVQEVKEVKEEDKE